MFKNFENLPVELQVNIFNFAIKCKKEQNIYLNKELTKLLNKKFCKCKGTLLLNKIICKECDKMACYFLNYLSYSFI